MNLPVLKELTVEEIFRKIVYSRFEKKKNTIIAITGPPGSGKSYTALRIAEIIQPDFNPEEQVVYHPKQLLEAIDKAREKKYKVIVLDEAHATIPARKWQSVVNLSINLVLSTFRQLHYLCLIVVTPTINEVDVSVRRLIDYYGVCDRTQDYVSLKLYRLEINRFDLKKQDPYINHIRFFVESLNRIVKIEELRITKPSEHIIQKYEEISKKFKSDLLKAQLNKEILEIKMPSQEVVAQTIDEVAKKIVSDVNYLSLCLHSGLLKQGIVKLRKSNIQKIFGVKRKFMPELEEKVREYVKKLGLIKEGGDVVE